LSGIVNQITKVAKDEIEGDISFFVGDYVSSRDDIYTNINEVSPTDISNIQGSLSGPIPGLGNAVKFFLSGRYFNDDGYIYGQRQFNPSDSSDFSANDPDDWHVGSTGDNEFIPLRSNRRYTLQGKLSFAVGDGKGIVLNALYQDQNYRDYDHRYKLNPDGDYERFNKSLLTSLSYTHVLSNSAFIDFIASGFQTNYNQYVFENPLDPGYVDPARKRDVSGNAFLTGGTENWHFEHTSTTYTGKIDMTWQHRHFRLRALLTIIPIRLIRSSLQYMRRIKLNSIT